MDLIPFDEPCARDFVEEAKASGLVAPVAFFRGVPIAC